MAFCCQAFSQDDNWVEYRGAIRWAVKYFQRNDTVFWSRIDTEMQTDIVVIKGFATNISRKKWITFHSDSSYTIVRYKKIKPSKWFKMNNDEFLNADFECKPQCQMTYNIDGTVIKRIYLGNIMFIKKK
jgi:hypothetical protein